MDNANSTPFWLDIKKEYIDDNFDKLLTYLQRTSVTKSDPYYETTLLLLRQRIEELISQLSNTPLYQEDINRQETIFNVKLLAAYLLVDRYHKLSQSAYVTFMYQLSRLTPRFSDIIVKNIMERLRHERVTQLGYGWSDLDKIGTDLFVHNLCTFATFDQPLTHPMYYENFGSARLDSTGLSITHDNLVDTRKWFCRGSRSVETSIGIGLHTENFEKMKVSARNNVVEMDEFVKNFIIEQRKVKPKVVLKKEIPYYESEVALVRITSIDQDGTINVETADPSHSKITGKLVFHKQSIVYYYTSTFHKIFRPGDYLRATIEDVNEGLFNIEKQLVRYFVESIRDALRDEGSDYPFLGKLIAESPSNMVWLTHWGVAMYTPKNENYERGEFAELTVKDIESGEYYGKIDACIIGSSDDTFEEYSLRNDCIRCYAEMATPSAAPVTEETVEKLSPALLRIILRQLFFYQKTLLKPSERFAYLANALVMAELVNDQLSASYIQFASTYLRALVQFVSHEDITDIHLYADEEYSNEDPTLIRQGVLQILKEYGKKESSGELAAVIDGFKERYPLLSDLAKLVHTANIMQGILSEAALNVLRREIIKTLSLETEDDADLEAENGSYLGVESGTQEFKTSMVYPPNNQMQADEYTQNRNVLRGICAFLNSTTGGTLYLGVNDQGYVTGIGNDMKYLNSSTIDNYMRYVQDTAIKYFGVDVTPYLHIEPLFDNTVVGIHVEAHPYRVVELDGTAYLRVNAESREMPEQVRLELIDRKVFKDKNRAAAISQLQHACSKKKRVILHSYASSHTGKVGDRLVEAYEIRPDDNLVVTFDCDKNVTRVFNINRIGYVEILENEPWKYLGMHRSVNVDVFHMTGDTPIHISLQMDLLAKNLLVEEYPRAKEYLESNKGDENVWYFDTNVYKLEGIGRFYLGLANHIHIIDAPELKKYIDEFKNKWL